jgi:hypothetical protein
MSCANPDDKMMAKTVGANDQLEDIAVGYSHLYSY